MSHINEQEHQGQKKECHSSQNQYKRQRPKKQVCFVKRRGSMLNFRKKGNWLSTLEKRKSKIIIRPPKKTE
jgi:hypothetical protein